MGRTAEKLEALERDFPSVKFLKIQGDVSRLDDIKAATQTVKEEWGTLDILINNAGVVSAGLLEEISDEDIINQVNVNVTGLILLTKHLLPLLKESDEAALMNISSGLGYIGMPFYSVYAAIKAAIDGLLNHKIEVILGGDQQKERIQTNLENPIKVDEKVTAQFEAIAK